MNQEFEDAKEEEERERLRELDYFCGAAYCDDPACQTHSPVFEDER